MFHVNPLLGKAVDLHEISHLIFSSPELAQGELLGYCDVRRPSYVWTSKTYETSVRQLFSLCTL